MKKLSKINRTLFENFSQFKIDNNISSRVLGGRTKDFEDNGSGGCIKVIDNNDGDTIKVKTKDRYDGRC